MAGFPFPLLTRRGRGSYRSAGGRSPFGTGRRGGGSGFSGSKLRLLMAAGIALFALISYFGNPGDLNQVTGVKERVAYNDEQDEIALGLQAAPQVAQQHGGASRDGAARGHVQNMGAKLLLGLQDYLNESGGTNPYNFDFHLLADPKTVNAFALPGGQVFITESLYRRLETEGQLAGVLGHEIGHVIERHGNKRMAKDKLFTSLVTAAGAAGGGVNSMQMAQQVKQMVSMKYGREDELESDKWGVKLCVLAGYDPRAMIGVMKILDEASPGGGPPEMLSTHPKPANRVEYIQKVIEETFPNGLPEGLRP